LKSSEATLLQTCRETYKAIGPIATLFYFRVKLFRKQTIKGNEKIVAEFTRRDFNERQIAWLTYVGIPIKHISRIVEVRCWEASNSLLGDYLGMVLTIPVAVVVVLLKT
jgi:hypothetical protein